jgi:hypothetical protein
MMKGAADTDTRERMAAEDDEQRRDAEPAGVIAVTAAYRLD